MAKSAVYSINTLTLPREKLKCAKVVKLKVMQLMPIIALSAGTKDIVSNTNNYLDHTRMCRTPTQTAMPDFDVKRP